MAGKGLLVKCKRAAWTNDRQSGVRLCAEVQVPSSPRIGAQSDNIYASM